MYIHTCIYVCVWLERRWKGILCSALTLMEKRRAGDGNRKGGNVFRLPRKAVPHHEGGPSGDVIRAALRDFQGDVGRAADFLVEAFAGGRPPPRPVELPPARPVR